MTESVTRVAQHPVSSAAADQVVAVGDEQPARLGGEFPRESMVVEGRPPGGDGERHF
jgi:hypothetical protein